MPSTAWKKAASQTDRKPVLHLAVESVNAIKKAITTKADWDASPILTNLNTASPFQEDAGAVILVTDGTEAHAGDYAHDEVVGLTASYGITETPAIVMSRPGPNDRVTRVVVSARVESDTFGPVTLTLQLQLSLNGGAYSTVHTETVTTFPKDITIDTEPLAKGHYDLRLVLTGPYAAERYDRNSLTFNSIRWSYETRYPLSGFLRTSTLDLGTVPTVASVFNVDDTIPAGATLTYGARGSNDDVNWAALGNVVDGGLLPPYRYYQFDVTFGSDGLATGILSEIGVSGGDDQFLHFSTHEDIPVKGAKPYLSATLGTLNSKLELMKLGSTGEVSPHLIYLKDTFEMIRDGYLRNKAVCLRYGFLGLDASEFEPLFTGLWYDYALDLVKSDLTVKTRTILSRLQKVQLPKEIAVDATRDDTTCPVVEWLDKNMVFVMLDLLDKMGIQDRYLDRDSFNALFAAGGARSGADWNVSRRLDKDSKEDIVKLLEELSVLSGVFLLQLPDGRLRASLYDPAAPIVLELSSDVATFGTVDGGQGDLYTRQQICYGQRHEGDLETGAARGGWLLGQDVSRNDTMTVSGVTWYCIQSHQTTVDTLPGLGALYRAYWAAEWTAGHSYAAGEVCLRGGPLYTCSVSHTADASTEPNKGEYWRDKWTTKPPKSGSGASDFYNAYTLINETAEVNWGLNVDVPFGDPAYLVNPGYQKQFLEKWNASPVARQALAERMDSWFANPKLKLKASNLPPQMWAGDNDEELLGSMVAVTGLADKSVAKRLVLPVPGAQWDVPCSRKKFFVLGKTLDPAKCTVSLDLLEV